MDPYDRAIYRHRPATSLDNPAFSWYPMKGPIPKGPKIKDYQHQLSCYTKTGLHPGTFIVNPEWISEDMHPRLPFHGRKWKPWPFEFQGARYWPHGTIENKLEEERNMKALVTARDLPQEFNPVEEEEQDELITATLKLDEKYNRTPWRPKTSSWHGYVVAKQNRPLSSGFTPHLYYSRHTSELQNLKGVKGFEEYFDHDSRYHSHHPDDIAPSNERSTAYGRVNFANQTKPIPLIADTPPEQRLRFDRPYSNMVNAMWLGTKYTTSPGQN